LESGFPIRKAAVEGSKEIFFAVISTSITLAVVFLPVIFLQGFVGRLFREFGVVLAAAVLISAFVSLTITPVLNVYLTRKNAQHGWFYQKTEPFFSGMERGYKKILQSFMKVRWLAWVIAAGVIIWLMSTSRRNAPLEDRNSIRLTYRAAEGTSYNYMRHYGPYQLSV
jgi:HAE1 family hydrophobic/amphiphilic exporter-1/multidrug efflux pump